MSKTLPPKINLHSEEREGGRKGEEGGRRRKGKSLSTGTEGKESPFQWNKNCAISIRTVCSDRGGSFLSRKWISVVSSDDQGICDHCDPCCLGGWRFFFFFNQMVFRGGNDLCNHLEMRYDVQRCKITDESIRHALPMGEHIHIFASPCCDLSACTVSTFAPKRVMDVEWGFFFPLFWERAFLAAASSVAGKGHGLLCSFSTVSTARVSTAPPQHILDCS